MLLAHDGRPQLATPVYGALVGGAEAVSADLNGDAIADFIVVTRSGGCGLAAQITWITFLLSSPNGYVARAVVSYDAAPTDLVDLNGDGRPEVLHCMFVDGDQGRDGRAHNYWVYNLLGFSGTRLVSANPVSREFPKWVAYTWAENHRNSTQLTASQREHQWLDAWAWKVERARSKTDLFPDMEAVAREQGRTVAPVRSAQPTLRN